MLYNNIKKCIILYFDKLRILYCEVLFGKYKDYKVLHKHGEI
jgi:hypothetical protein